MVVIAQLFQCGEMVLSSSSGGTYRASRFVARTEDGKVLVLFLDEASQLKILAQQLPEQGQSG